MHQRFKPALLHYFSLYLCSIFAHLILRLDRFVLFAEGLFRGIAASLSAHFVAFFSVVCAFQKFESVLSRVLALLL